MAIIITPDSELVRELAKWNKPYRYERYPLMLYRAARRPDGIISISERDDRIFGGDVGSALRFSESCQLKVYNDDEYRNALNRGYREDFEDCKAALEERERAVGELAAVRAFEDRNMSDKAKAEAAAAEAETVHHVAEVPEKPVKRGPGRPRKTDPPPQAA